VIEMSKTVFEKIIDREIPATIEFEDDELIAIRDVAPTAAVHVLIIPKRVIASVNDLTDDDAALVGRIHVVAKNLAEKFGIANSGYRVITNTNADAGQTVAHLHFHLIGGEPLGRMNTRLADTVSALPKSFAARIANSFKISLRETGLLVLMSVGLAIGFNMMNSKSITWMKKEFERVQASDSDLDKYGISGGSTTDPASRPSGSGTSSLNTNDGQQANTQFKGQQANAQINGQQANAQQTGQTKNAQANAQQTNTQQNGQQANAKQTEPTQPPAFVPEPGVVREINLQQFKKLMSAGAYYLIDARTAESFAKGHIGNAVNYYGGEVQGQIPNIMANVPRDRVILIYCDGGECELSHHVADVLKQFGYGPTFIFTGGWAEWIKQPK